MKRLLEVFPESVFICSKDPSTLQTSVWTNYQFEQDICKVQESIDELNKVIVRVNPEINEEETKEYIVDTLDKLINRHQQNASDEMSHECTESIEVSNLILNHCIDKKDKVNLGVA